jgi:UDP-N-acetyl-D-glucosamine dehydrogenase
VDEIDVHPLKMASVELSDEALTSADCVVITTDHASLEYGRVASQARCIVDTRNALKGVPVEAGQVFKL